MASSVQAFSPFRLTLYIALEEGNREPPVFEYLLNTEDPFPVVLSPGTFGRF
jgi:hypothetical protein